VASIFVVGRGQDTFAALSSSTGLCRERFGAVVAVGTWFGLTHLVLFMVATSVVTLPLTFAPILPTWAILIVVLLLTLLYFALVDTLYLARMAGHVAILEGPIIPVVASVQQSAISIQPQTAAVDQDELILSDRSLLASLRDRCLLAWPTEAVQVDQDERILCDTENISGTASESSSQDEPNAK
jgi:hypothetical protein